MKRPADGKMKGLAFIKVGARGAGYSCMLLHLRHASACTHVAGMHISFYVCAHMRSSSYQAAACWHVLCGLISSILCPRFHTLQDPDGYWIEILNPEVSKNFGSS